MVQRYSKYGSDNHFIDRHGKWVKFEDYQNLDLKLLEVEAELQKYKDQFPDYVECGNCGSATHVEGVGPDKKEAWVLWHGGENPVLGKWVDVKFRSGEIAYCENSCLYYWGHDYLTDSDIIAYRVVG